jgi:hypothetical protein
MFIENLQALDCKKDTVLGLYKRDVYLLQGVAELAVDASVHAPERAVYLFVAGSHYLVNDHSLGCGAIARTYQSYLNRVSELVALTEPSHVRH